MWWYQPLALGVLVVACILMGFFGAESRPHFMTGKLHPKERWFIHNRQD